MNRIAGILGTIFMVVITAVITAVVGYYVTRSVPDVKYTLSEKIPVTFADPTNTTLETVQQLEVKNIGNAEANKIVVKIKGSITDYKIYKYSAADNFQAFDKQQPVEFVYSQLPPQAGFKIVFKTASEGVEYGDISISHNTGVAREALAGTGTSTGTYLGCIFVFYLIIIVMVMRPSSIDWWKSGLDNLVKVSQMGRPWFLFDNEWTKIRSTIIKELLKKNDYWINDIKSAPYHFLSMEQPNHIPAFEWKEFTELAEKNLERIYTTLVNKAFSISPIMALLNADKPQYFPQTQWNSLEEMAIKQYVSLRSREFYSQESVIKALKETKPQKISQEAWNELTQHWELLFRNDVLRNLKFTPTSDIVDFVRELDLSMLSDNGKQALQQVLEPYVSIVETTRLIDLMLNGEPLGEDEPEEIEERRWMQLKRIESQLIKLEEVERLAEKNQCDAESLEIERSQLSTIREKIEHQLNFINELLNDPTRIERVEEYDDTFAPGNLANLKRVAQLLLKADGNAV